MAVRECNIGYCSMNRNSSVNYMLLLGRMSDVTPDKIRSSRVPLQPYQDPLHSRRRHDRCSLLWLIDRV